jgi:hypothetical protein
MVLLTITVGRAVSIVDVWYSEHSIGFSFQVLYGIVARNSLPRARGFDVNAGSPLTQHAETVVSQRTSFGHIGAASAKGLRRRSS